MNLVSIEEVKSWLRIEHSDDDAFLNRAIAMVSSYAQERTGRTFVETLGTEYLDGGERFLIVGNPSISSIATITDTEDSTVVDSGDYDFDPGAGLIYRDDNADWGAGFRRWEVVYVGGTTTVPEDLKLAMLSLVAKAHDSGDLEASSVSIGDWSKVNGAFTPGAATPEEIFDRYWVGAF